MEVRRSCVATYTLGRTTVLRATGAPDGTRRRSLRGPTCRMAGKRAGTVSRHARSPSTPCTVRTWHRRLGAPRAVDRTPAHRSHRARRRRPRTARTTRTRRTAARPIAPVVPAHPRRLVVPQCGACDRFESSVCRIAHRGGCAGVDRKTRSTAFDLGMAAGADGLELDVHLVGGRHCRCAPRRDARSDDQRHRVRSPVAPRRSWPRSMRDAGLWPVAGGRRSAAGDAFGRDGTRIPMLRDVLRALSRRFAIIVEMKVDSTADGRRWPTTSGAAGATERVCAAGCGLLGAERRRGRALPRGGDERVGQTEVEGAGYVYSRPGPRCAADGTQAGRLRAGYRRDSPSAPACVACGVAVDSSGTHTSSAFRLKRAELCVRCGERSVTMRRSARNG